MLERAQRYAITLPMRYRLVGEETWAAGTTVDISRSGVLFEGERSVDREAAIEPVLTMPVDVADGARVVARGVVVRATAQRVADAQPNVFCDPSPITLSFGRSAITAERSTRASVFEWH